MLGVIGLDHHDAPTPVRERLAILDEGLVEPLATLRRSEALSEAVILSTCTRTETYAAGPSWAAVRVAVEEFLGAQYLAGATARQLAEQEALSQYLYVSE